jgi:hypothetical protein
MRGLNYGNGQKIGSTQTDPGAIDPFHQGGWAGPRIQIGPVRQDFVDTCVDLRFAQLHGEGDIGTTWPRVQPHYSHPLTERLNPATEKCLQKLHSRQSLLS